MILPGIEGMVYFISQPWENIGKLVMLYQPTGSWSLCGSMISTIIDSGYCSQVNEIAFELQMEFYNFNVDDLSSFVMLFKQ